MIDYLIVGSGLFGATFAHQMQKRGRQCLVIDRREHLGGNIYNENVEGINVHKYGAHIFHTSNREVWRFVNDIVEFNRYTNSPVACWKGHYYNLPFNMNTFNEIFDVHTPREASERLEQERREARKAIAERHGIAVDDCTPEALKRLGIEINLEEQAQLLIGKTIYERLIKGYTEKQWGRSCEDLPGFIIRRLPVRLVYDNNYFNDAYQGIPIGGYNKLTAGLLDGVETRTGIDFKDLKRERRDGVWHVSGEGIDVEARTIVYTGQIDEFFGYELGQLAWRTVRFETETIDEANYQGNAVVNYTERSVPWTRIIEHKHFESFGQAVYDNPKTVISREFSTEWKRGMEPFYPVNDERNNSLAEQYRQKAAREEGVIFGGRLADYRYYDMAPVIEKAMKAAEEEK